MLKKIEEKLCDIAQNGTVKMLEVSYGLAPKQLDIWNYIVYNRAPASKDDGSRSSYVNRYQVHLICENAVPEGYVQEVIAKVLEIKGLKLDVNKDIEFDYIRKNNTNLVVEMATINFTHGVLIGVGKNGKI